ncbi:MAG: DUF1631 domain-containing protein [Gammaproteobacteria bacterium]|nr:DUF1631 domain-containing protein [Gammaproteobacteria bacterium]
MQKKNTEPDARNALLVVERLLDKLVSKADYSSHVIGFLHDTWKLVLCNIFLTKGESSKHWKHLKKISSMLCWSLQAKNGIEEKRMLVEALPSLLHALSRGLDLIQMEPEQKQEVFKMLAIEHARIIRHSLEIETTGIDKNPASPDKNMLKAQLANLESNTCEIDYILSEEATGDIQVVDINTSSTHSSSDVIQSMDDFSTNVQEGKIQFNDEEIIELVMQQVSLANEEPSETTSDGEHTQNLAIGVWVNFDTSGTINKVGELFWKSRVTGKCVFLNEQGHKIVTISESDLDAELKSGKAELTKVRI